MRSLEDLTNEINKVNYLLDLARKDESIPEEILFDLEDQIDDLEHEIKYHQDINIRNEGEPYDEDYM